jgi:hypothetical protein
MFIDRDRETFSASLSVPNHDQTFALCREPIAECWDVGGAPLPPMDDPAVWVAMRTIHFANLTPEQEQRVGYFLGARLRRWDHHDDGVHNLLIERAVVLALAADEEDWIAVSPQCFVSGYSGDLWLEVLRLSDHGDGPRG